MPHTWITRGQASPASRVRGTRRAVTNSMFILPNLDLFTLRSALVIAPNGLNLDSIRKPHTAAGHLANGSVMSISSRLRRVAVGCMSVAAAAGLAIGAAGPATAAPSVQQLADNIKAGLKSPSTSTNLQARQQNIAAAPAPLAVPDGTTAPRARHRASVLVRPGSFQRSPMRLPTLTSRRPERTTTPANPRRVSGRSSWCTGRGRTRTTTSRRYLLT